jgi:myo-inositol-1(or 4)-monophosphatase
LVDWEDILSQATTGAMKAANRAAQRGERGLRVGVGAAGDKTLVADRDAEDEIFSALTKAEGFWALSEERGEVGQSGSRWKVIIDPVDGSSNFERGIPFYCSSIAVLDGKRLSDAKYAAVRDLVRGDLYYAEKGKGTFLNGRRVRTSKTKEVDHSVLAVDMCRAGEHVVKRLALLVSTASRQVHLGANALELSLIAAGSIDGFVDVRKKMRVTDFAGGYLLVKEAGGQVTTETGEVLDPDLDLKSRFSYVAAANPPLHAGILSMI